MPHEAKGFQCDFCPRMFESLADAARHEDACKFNPAMKRCYTCKHGEIVFETVLYDLNGNSEESGGKGKVFQHFECKHFGKLILRDVRDIDFYSDGDGINPALPKPGTCAWWEWDGDEDDDV